MNEKPDKKQATQDKGKPPHRTTTNMRDFPLPEKKKQKTVRNKKVGCCVA